MDPQFEDQVAKLLGGLRKVNAPENFETRVKARLSTAPPRRDRLGFLKLAVPTAALAGIALFLFLSGYIATELPPVEVVSTAEKGTDAPRPDTSQDQNAFATNGEIEQPREYRRPESADSRPGVSPSQPAEKFRKNSDRLKGSVDSASDPQEKIITPRGFDPNSRPGHDANSEREMRRPTILATDVLRYTGVSAEFRGNGWSVRSVAQNSVAQRIGVKAGDLIVSLNDIRLTRDTAFPSGVDIKIIRVSRNGSIVELKF